MRSKVAESSRVPPKSAQRSSAADDQNDEFTFSAPIRLDLPRMKSIQGPLFAPAAPSKFIQQSASEVEVEKNSTGFDAYSSKKTVANGFDKIQMAISKAPPVATVASKISKNGSDFGGDSEFLKVKFG